MKKLAAGSVVFLCTLAAAVGEITFSGSGSAVIVPFGARFGDPLETVAGNEVRWGDDGPEITLTANGKNEAGTIGATVAINAYGTGLKLGGNAKAWLKPHEIVKVTLGRFEEDDLRYKIGVSGGGFHNYLLYIRGDNLDESAFFSRFKSEGVGLHLGVTPGNFYFGAALGSTFGTRSVKQLREDGATDVYANAQVGAGYKIENIGFVRILFNGSKPTEDDGSDTAGFQKVGAEATGRSPTIQGAFQLTAVKGLNIDIGGQVPLPYEYTPPPPPQVEATEQRPYIVGIGFDTTLPSIPLRFYGRVSYQFGGYTEITDADDETTKTMVGNNLLFSITPMYTFAPNWIVGLEYMLDIRHDSDESAVNTAKTAARGGDTDAQYLKWVGEPEQADLKNNYLDMGIGLYVRHNFAGGDVRVGTTVKIPGGDAHEGAKPQLFFPIILNYNF
jgi:hypothetical protein